MMLLHVHVVFRLVHISRQDMYMYSTPVCREKKEGFTELTGNGLPLISMGCRLCSVSLLLHCCIDHYFSDISICLQIKCIDGKFKPNCQIFLSVFTYFNCMVSIRILVLHFNNTLPKKKKKKGGGR